MIAESPDPRGPVDPVVGDVEEYGTLAKYWDASRDV